MLPAWAATMLLASETAVKKYSLKPIAKVVSAAVAAVDPAVRASVSVHS